jgi:hypothetical protein
MLSSAQLCCGTLTANGVVLSVRVLVQYYAEHLALSHYSSVSSVSGGGKHPTAAVG